MKILDLRVIGSKDDSHYLIQLAADYGNDIGIKQVTAKVQSFDIDDLVSHLKELEDWGKLNLKSSSPKSTDISKDV